MREHKSEAWSSGTPAIHSIAPIANFYCFHTQIPSSEPDESSMSQMRPPEVEWMVSKKIDNIDNIA
jgi:hypothetical protein